MPEPDLLEILITKIAEAVVTKMEERRKIDLIAEAVLARLQEQSEVPSSTPAGMEEGEPTPEEEQTFPALCRLP